MCTAPSGAETVSCDLLKSLGALPDVERDQISVPESVQPSVSRYRSVTSIVS